MPSLGIASQLSNVCLSRVVNLGEERHGQIDGRQNFVYVGDPMKLELFCQTCGFIRLGPVFQSQRHKID